MALLESMPSSSTKLFPSSIFNSAALEVTTVPPNFNPLVPSWEATSKSLVPSLTVTSPSSATLSAATTAYTTSNEVSGTNYSAKGGELTRIDPSTSGTTALTDFADETFSSSTITARGALIFNDSASGDPAVCVLDFGADKSSSSGDFTVVFPAADASNAIIRIA